MKLSFKVSDDVELGRLLDSLAFDIVDAHVHFKMALLHKSAHQRPRRSTGKLTA